MLDIAFLLFTFTTLPHLLSNIWNFDNILAPSYDQQSLLGFDSKPAVIERALAGRCNARNDYSVVIVLEELLLCC